MPNEVEDALHDLQIMDLPLHDQGCLILDLNSLHLPQSRDQGYGRSDERLSLYGMWTQTTMSVDGTGEYALLSVPIPLEGHVVRRARA